nr:dynamin family protein [Lachnospiraceae bacterium]
NCVEEILDLINKFINTTGELEIDFIGTDEDFGVLRTAVLRDKNPKSKGIVCECSERYLSSADALKIIKDAYEQIKTEFDDYIDNASIDEEDERAEIGRTIVKFRDTVKAEIPVCVIGNYSVGKSALVNSLIGREILPSHANSTTAKNVLIENGDVYRIIFDCSDVHYNLEIEGSIIKRLCDGEIDEELISALTSGTEGMENEEQILHQMIENLNKEVSEDKKLAGIESNVRVIVPFRESELATDKYSFVFIDTPGGNNGDSAQRIHRENLEKLMDEQTNALPIFAMDRKSLTSEDTNDLKTLLENKETGFAVQNCIIVISMSDQLVEQQLTEELPDKVKQWNNHPTIMYVSPVAAIGEKKSDKNDWIDGAYRQIYEKKLADLPDVNPPKYNETPCGRNMSKDRIKSVSPLLYASGIPSLETEINYFAYRFAEYKKCTNGREYLLKALQIANNRLQEAKEQLEKDKKNKEKEQEAVKTNLKKSIDAVQLPAVYTVTSSVYNDFEEVLNEYCAGVEEIVKATWKEYKGKIDAMDGFEKAMADHCQKNLYDTNIKAIKESIEKSYINLTSEYMSNVRKVVTDQYDRLSDAAQNELNELFEKDDNGPTWPDVKVDEFEKIKFIILGALPFDFTQDIFVEQYARKFRLKLRGSGKTYGIFALQCIVSPAREYSKQIEEWSKNYKAQIDTTLDRDNAILSELDEKIKNMEVKIEDMEKRLKNLTSVEAMLKNVLPNDMEEADV